MQTVRKNLEAAHTWIKRYSHVLMLIANDDYRSSLIAP